MPGDDRDLSGETAVGHGDPGIGGHRVGRGHAWDDLELDPRRAQLERLLAAAAKDERIAALQSYDTRPPATQVDQQGVDLLLAQRV